MKKDVFPQVRTGKALGMMAATLLASGGVAHAQDERYQWLEEPQSAKALSWAAEQSKAAQAKIGTLPDRAAIEAELRTLLTAGDPPPQFHPLGNQILRFRRSVANPHGVLSIASKDAAGRIGAWRDLLDVDALRKADGKPYEFHTYSFADACLAPDYTRCIFALSPAGADDVELREFDLKEGRFVANGFRVPASRAQAVWMDRDHLLIEHALGDAPKLATGWPTTISLWTRGTPLESARVVYRAQPNDAIMTLTTAGSGDERVGVISRAIDYSNLETLIVRKDGSVETTAIPQRRSMMAFATGGDWIVTQLAEEAKVGGRALPAETVVAYDVRRVTPADKRFSVVALPNGRDFLSGFSGLSAGRTTVRMAMDSRGVKRLDTATFANGKWTVARGAAEPVGTSISVAVADPAGDDAVLQRTGYLLPTRLDLSGAGGRSTELFAEKPVFDTSRFTVDLKTARSKDGTEIDYYLLRPKSPARPGETPTLMTGYGAFAISFTPGYLDAIVGGRSLVPWLTRGGALVLPLIRGGGDRGEAWHLAAIREKRQNSYDDFAAVSEALIGEGFTKPRHLGVFGQSNGGLLAATMGTQRPDLYGAIVSDVPLTDLIRMPLMGMGAAWTNEYGDPGDPVMAAAIKRYSPFQNVQAGKSYPPFMLTVATSDNRVGPGHARKMAARLIDAGSEVYYLEDQEGGHGVSDPLSRPELMADRMTFLIDKLR